MMPIIDTVKNILETLLLIIVATAFLCCQIVFDIWSMCQGCVNWWLRYQATSSGWPLVADN
jgi:hypothetical protein